MTITSRNNDLKYWDETDKIRKVEKVEMGVAGPVIGPAILSDLDIILGEEGSKDQKSKPRLERRVYTAPTTTSTRLNFGRSGTRPLWTNRSWSRTPRKKTCVFPRFDAIENPDTPVKPKPFWRFR